MSYCFYNQNFKVDNLGFKKSKAIFGNLGIKAIDWVRKTANEALAEEPSFPSACRYPRSGKNGTPHCF